MLQASADGYELTAGTVVEDRSVRDRAVILLLSSLRDLADGVRGSAVYSALREQRALTNAAIIAESAFTASDIRRRAGFDGMRFTALDREGASVTLSFAVENDTTQADATVEI
jgi:hypothetical protein